MCYIKTHVYLFSSFNCFRVEPPNIDSSLCITYENEIALQLQSLNGDSDSEDDNYFEWEAVSKNVLLKFKI